MFVKSDLAVVFRFTAVVIALLWSIWGKRCSVFQIIPNEQFTQLICHQPLTKNPCVELNSFVKLHDRCEVSRGKKATCLVPSATILLVVVVDCADRVPTGTNVSWCYR